jgi:hypothetical protein
LSYGRDPFYVYPCVCDGTYDGEPNGHPAGRHVAFAAGGCAVLWDELAQFAASAAWRGELGALVARGRELRPDLTKQACSERVCSVVPSTYQNRRKSR